MKELEVAIEAAQAGGKIIMEYYGKKFAIHHKGVINLVTEVDEKAQETICQVLNKHFPRDAILAEEGDLSETKSAKRRWIVDPIDGTTNFAHSYPMFCVSIAFEENGELKAGVIYDPLKKELFTAIKGQGAFLNGKPIKVSQTKELKESMLITGFPYDLNDPKFNNMKEFIFMLKKVQCIRRDGSAAIDLAYIACGRADGFWEYTLKPWDISAGILLVEEAGGKISHITGRPLEREDHAVIGSNPHIYEALLRELKSITAA